MVTEMENRSVCKSVEKAYMNYMVCKMHYRNVMDDPVKREKAGKRFENASMELVKALRKARMGVSEVKDILTLHF